MEESSESWSGSRGSVGDDPWVDPARQARRKSLKVAGFAVVALILVGVIASLLHGSAFAKATVVPPSANQRLRSALSRFDAAVKAGDPQAYVSAHAELADRMEAWINAFSESASLDSVFSAPDDEICAGCSLLPRAMKALAAPIPPNVVANMTQLDKDRMEVRKIQWSLINAFVPAFEQLCDRYVDPVTGKMRMAKPD